MLTDKEKKVLANAEKQLAIPKWKFVFIRGVLGWGIFTALLYTVAFTLLFRQVSFSEILKKDIWINLITFMIAGVFFGLMLRWLMKKQIDRLKEKELLS